MPTAPVHATTASSHAHELLSDIIDLRTGTIVVLLLDVTASLGGAHAAREHFTDLTSTWFQPKSTDVTAAVFKFAWNAVGFLMSAMGIYALSKNDKELFRIFFVWKLVEEAFRLLFFPLAATLISDGCYGSSAIRLRSHW
ncbi:hypothetical protein GGF32_005483 [Allomyces javanicus]|nr:hypothetical protein GGF32_005483 [Allomyces javanicus]